MRGLEQALRPEDEHQRHEERGQDLGQRRLEEGRDHAVRHADQQGRNQRAAERPEAPDHHDDEGQEQRIAPHQVMGLLDRHDQHGRDGRERRAEREGAGIDTVHIDAEGGGGLAVDLRGAHHEADPAPREKQPQARQHRARRADHEELVARPAEPRQLQPRLERRRHRPRLGAVKREGRLLQDVEKPDRRDDRGLGLVGEPLQHQPVGQGREPRHQQRTGHQRHGEGERGRARHPLAHEPGGDRAQHEELAMGHVHHPQHAEDEAQPRSRQREHRRADQPLHHREKQEGSEVHPQKEVAR